jgi:integrase/recombinase XerC
MDIQTAISTFQKELVGGKAQATIRTYNNGINKFKDYLNVKKIPTTLPVENLTPDIFIDFPLWLGQESYAKQTTNVYLSGVKSFMDWLVIAGVLEITYSQGVRWVSVLKRVKRKRETKLPRWPKRDDTKKMIDAVKTMPEKSPILERDIAMVLFLESSGCRNDEVAKLRLKNINLTERSAIVTGKGSKERRVFFSIEAGQAIRNYFVSRKFGTQDEYPLFARHDKGAGKKVKSISTTTVRNIISDVAKLAGVKPFSPHYFRHAFAIRMLSETHDLALVQDLLGHTNPSATRVYAKIYAEDLKAGHRKVYG